MDAVEVGAGGLLGNEKAATEMETAVAQAICVEQWKDRQLSGTPTDADIDQARHLAKAAIKAIMDFRTVATAADVPVQSVAYSHSDGSVVARFDEDNGIGFGDKRQFPWSEKYLEGELTILWHPDSERRPR